MKKYLEEKIKALRIEIEANRAISNYQDAFKNQIRLDLLIEVVNENEHLGNVIAFSSEQEAEVESKRYAKKQWNTVGLLLSKDYKIGYQEGIYHYLKDKL
jgi:hypothetical protein